MFFSAPLINNQYILEFDSFVKGNQWQGNSGKALHGQTEVRFEHIWWHTKEIKSKWKYERDIQTNSKHKTDGWEEQSLELQLHLSGDLNININFNININDH